MINEAILLNVKQLGVSIVVTITAIAVSMLIGYLVLKFIKI